MAILNKVFFTFSQFRKSNMSITTRKTNTEVPREMMRSDYTYMAPQPLVRRKRSRPQRPKSKVTRKSQVLQELTNHS